MNGRPFLGPLVQQSTPSIIADKLRMAIGHGELEAGSQLYEAELSRGLGVSRGPLREAIQRLTQEGLLLAIRNRGVFVIQMTPDRVRDMYLARAAVERAAAEQILRTGRAEEACAALLGVVEEMQQGVDSDEIAATSAADLRFHELLVNKAHSPRLSRMHSTLLTETRMCITALERSYRFDDGRVDEHRSIAEALRSGCDSDDAARTTIDRLLVEHMNDAIRRLSTSEEPSSSGTDPDPAS